MASSRLSYRARPVRTGLVGPVSRADPHRGGSGASPGGSPYWSLFGFLGTLWASASPRSRIVFNDFWVLSRRERCLDNTQKSLRAAWIGVMQKDWITKDLSMPRVVASALGGSDAASWEPALGESSGCGLDRRLEFVAEFSGP